MMTDVEFSRRHPGVQSAVCVLLTVLLTSSVALAELGPGADPGHAVTQPHHFETNGATLDRADFPLQVVLVGDAPDDVSNEAWAALLEASVATWSEVPCSYAELEYGGRRDSASDVAAGEIPIVTSAPGCVPEDIAGWTTFTPCGEFPSRSVFLNTTDFEWSVEPMPFQELDEDRHPRILDLESAMTHELGHVLGLSHPDDPLATMYASYRPDGSMRMLALDDKLGICSLYEADDPVAECSDETPCPEPQSCVDAQGFTLCQEFRGEVGDQCGLDRLVCEQRCALVNGQTGYCTTSCEHDEQCPDDFDCIDGFLGENQGSFCARLDTDEPPRGCCTNSVADASDEPMHLWLIVAGLCVVYLRRRRLS